MGYISVPANPEEETPAHLHDGVGVNDAVPNRLEDAGEGGDTNTGADEDSDLVLEDVLRGGTKGPVNHDAGQGGGGGAVVVLLELAAEPLGEGGGEVTHNADVNADVVLLRGGRDGEGMPLETRDLGAVEEEVLARLVPHGGLLDLDLNDFGGVLDNLGDVRLEPAADFPDDPLHHVEENAGNTPLP